MKVDAARLVAGMGIRPMGEVYDETDNTWPMVVVQWRDTHAAPGTWVMTEDYEPEEVLPISVGWVWPKKKEGFLTLVGTVVNTAEDPEMVSDVNHIPFENVVRMFSLVTHLPINFWEEGLT